MSLADVRKAFAQALQAAIPTVTVYDAPRNGIEKHPAIFVTIGQAAPSSDETAIEYRLNLALFAYAGRTGERVQVAEDEMDTMLGGTIAFVESAKGGDDAGNWQGAKIESIGKVVPAVVDGEDYTFCEAVVVLVLGYASL